MNINTFRDIITVLPLNTINGFVPPTVYFHTLETATRPFIFVEDLMYQPAPGFMRVTQYKCHIVTGITTGPSPDEIEQYLEFFEDQSVSPCDIALVWEVFPDSPEPVRVLQLTFTLDTDNI